MTFLGVIFVVPINMVVKYSHSLYCTRWTISFLESYNDSWATFATTMLKHSKSKFGFNAF